MLLRGVLPCGGNGPGHKCFGLTVLGKLVPVYRYAGPLHVASGNRLPRSIEMPDIETNFEIRPVEARDLDQIVALDERVTEISKRDYLYDLFERYKTRRPDQRFFYVAVTDRQVIGFVVGEIRAWEFGSEPCGWVFAISVDPDAREDSVGSALLDQICARFRQAGVHRLRTMISRNNKLLMSFFRAHGLMAGPYIQLEKDLT